MADPFRLGTEEKAEPFFFFLSYFPDPSFIRELNFLVVSSKNRKASYDAVFTVDSEPRISTHKLELPLLANGILSVTQYSLTPLKFIFISRTL